MANVDVKPFVLTARLYTRSEEKAKEEIELLKDIARFESKQEPCGSYLCVEPLEGDQTTLIVFEAYDNKDYLLNDHMKCDAYQKLQSHVAKSDTRPKPPEASFYVPKAGFLQRNEPSKVPVADQFIWIAKLTAHPGKRDELMKIILIHTSNVERDENETLTFLVLESTDDDVSVLLFERYTTEKYFRETHFTSESMATYRENMQPFLAQRDSAGYRPVAGFLDKREDLV